MNSRSAKGMHNLKKLALFSAIMGCFLGGSNDAFATASCFCKLSCADLTNHTSASAVVKDYGVLTTYGGINQQSDSNQTACNTLCTSHAASDTGSQAVASASCALGCPDGAAVRAWSAVGTKEYKTAQYIGTLQHRAQVTLTTCKCPQGWAANMTNVEGGVTADGKCKKLACQPIAIAPPANGTALGSWGFSWGNALIAWGTTGNGGAPLCTTVVTSQAVCKF